MCQQRGKRMLGVCAGLLLLVVKRGAASCKVAAVLLQSDHCMIANQKLSNGS
jgi:hypothetical protein